MASSVAMFEAFFAYFQYVNARAGHVKIDRVSGQCRPGPSKSVISLVV